VYQQAKQIFQAFIEKAAGKNEYAGAVKKSQERMQDIDDTVTFLQAGGPTDTAQAPPAASGSQAPAAGSAAPGTDNSAPPPPAAPNK
jgi:hypothetical protein